MSAGLQWAIAIGVVFAVNLLPAFGPPTWSLLLFFSLDFQMPTVLLVVGGALAAASGRLLLATTARRLRPHFSAARLRRLDRAEAALTRNRGRSLFGLGLFAVSPLPSGQLFLAAGLLTVPLLPLSAAFFAGRLVSYSIYVSAGSVAVHGLGAVALDSLLSPLGVALQVAMLLAVALLAGGLGTVGLTAPSSGRYGRPPVR